VVKKGGKIVSLVGAEDAETEKARRQYGVEYEHMVMRPDGQQLRQITKLAEQGKVRP
jgi:hypothetical protein